MLDSHSADQSPERARIFPKQTGRRYFTRCGRGAKSAWNPFPKLPPWEISRFISELGGSAWWSVDCQDELIAKTMRNTERWMGHGAVMAVALASALFLEPGKIGATLEQGFAGTGNPYQRRTFAAKAECETCHDKVLTEKKAGKHSAVGCETCHGSLAKHAEDPDAAKPDRPKAATLCARCHESAGQAGDAPQIVVSEHYGGASCTDCHNPHNPKQ